MRCIYSIPNHEMKAFVAFFHASKTSLVSNHLDEVRFFTLDAYDGLTETVIVSDTLSLTYPLTSLTASENIADQAERATRTPW